MPTKRTRTKSSAVVQYAVPRRGVPGAALLRKWARCASSKAVVNGDVTQIDLGRGQKSGLIESRRILDGVRGIAFTEFGAQDVVRHPLVARIIDAYEKAKQEE